MLNALTDQSGSGVRFWSIGKELARRGHSVMFLERSISKNGRTTEGEIKYRSTADTGFLCLDVMRATLFNFLHGLAFRPEYVLALKSMPNSCLPALLLKSLFGCRIILDIDDLDFEYYRDRLRRGLVRLWFTRFPPHFDLVTTHNPYLRNFILKDVSVPPEKIYHLTQGIEVERFLRASPDESSLQKYGVDVEDKVIVYSASLGITSDFTCVLPMLIELLHSCDDIKILVAGDGQRREHFIRSVQESGMEGRMIFTGYVPHSEMPGMLKLARVGINYMAPTVANQCRASIKLREYLAAGLKVVCNPVGDAEVFKDHVTLCSKIEEFPAAIRKALAVDDRDGVEKAQGFIERNYSWPRLVGDFLTCLTDI